MRYFIDTEFIEDGKTIDLLSIGIVAEDGREFYGVNLEADRDKADQWVKENVLPYVDVRLDNMSGPEYFGNRRYIRDRIREFITTDPQWNQFPLEFWGYYADYDWVVFCQLFGRMIDLPKGWPMYCRDLKQWADQLGDIQLPPMDVEGEPEHHALCDARWNFRAWKLLVMYVESVRATNKQRELVAKKLYEEFRQLAGNCVSYLPLSRNMANDRLLTEYEEMLSDKKGVSQTPPESRIEP